MAAVYIPVLEQFQQVFLNGHPSITPVDLPGISHVHPQLDGFREPTRVLDLLLDLLLLGGLDAHVFDLVVTRIVGFTGELMVMRLGDEFGDMIGCRPPWIWWPFGDGPTAC